MEPQVPEYRDTQISTVLNSASHPFRQVIGEKVPTLLRNARNLINDRYPICYHKVKAASEDVYGEDGLI